MKHKYIAKKYWKDQSTPMGKIDDLIKQTDNLINFSLGDPDINTHDIIINRAFEDAKKGHTKYTAFRGDNELIDSICDMYHEDYDVSIKNEEVLVCSSGCLAMHLVLEAILDDNDEVLIHSPYFTPYKQQIELSKGIPIEVPTYAKDNYQLDVNILETYITERSKAIIINSPCNPTGAMFSDDTIKKIIDIAIKYDLIIIADEIYNLFSFGQAFRPILSFENAKNRTITINSFSKDFVMTGWRLGNVIAPVEIIKIIQQINENVGFTANSISQRGAIAGIQNRKQVQKEIYATYKKRVNYAYTRISKIKNLSVNKPMGTFYLFPSIKETGLSSQEAMEIILKESGILTIPGNSFGEVGEGYLRLALTVDVDKLKEAFDRLEKVSIFQ